MIQKKFVIVYVLILSITILPVLSVAAAEKQDMQTMLTAYCADCGTSDGGSHDFCAKNQCLVSTGVCVTQLNSAYLPGLLSVPKMVLPFFENRHASQILFRSHLAFSIYRPPIA